MIFSNLANNNIINVGLKIIGVVSGGLLGFFLFRFSEVLGDARYVLRSIIFQITVALLALYTTSTGQSFFISSFLLAAFFRSFYEQYQDYKRHNLQRWFSSLDGEPSSGFLAIYFVVLGLVFIYSLLNFLR